MSELQHIDIETHRKNLEEILAWRRKFDSIRYHLNKRYREDIKSPRNVICRYQFYIEYLSGENYRLAVEAEKKDWGFDQSGAFILLYPDRESPPEDIFIDLGPVFSIHEMPKLEVFEQQATELKAEAIRHFNGPSSSKAERPAHNGTVIGSSPVAATTQDGSGEG